MYKYTEKDLRIVSARVKEFKLQVKRRILGELTEDEFKPLRLMNGLYLQLHAYMLRIAIPYGELSTTQLEKLSKIAKKYDRGYGHFTTRQNIQLNWPKLTEVPKILDELSKVEMHAIQTSGNCIRNISADHFAGITSEEVEDPRPWCEIIRKWSTFHPEFSFLPRKFKIAITGCKNDRAAIELHDIGLRLVKKNNKIGFQIFVGGGQGRTPVIGKEIRNFLPTVYILSYLESILRVYNELGRRDNIYKARIKILVNELGIKKFKNLVNKEWSILKNTSILSKKEILDSKKYFKNPIFVGSFSKIPNNNNDDYNKWLKHNVRDHKVRGYSIIIISLKSENLPPGDLTSEQMLKISKVAKRFSFEEIRVSHEQNLILPHVENKNLFKVWKILEKINVATPNIGMITDTICCPGMDYCALATARSIPIAQRINEHFNNIELQQNIGELKIKISGCINACGHHHIGNIGILGLDKNGEEYYQITLGGCGKEDSKIGKIIGPSFSSDDVIIALEKITNVYLKLRKNKNESFMTTLNLIGLEPFKKILYGNN